MDVLQPAGQVEAFTQELLRVGLTVSEVAADLIETLPADAYPGEAPAAVVLAMMTGTIQGAVGDVDRAELQMATDLIGLAADRVLEHLLLALEYSRRRESGVRGAGINCG